MKTREYLIEQPELQGGRKREGGQVKLFYVGELMKFF